MLFSSDRSRESGNPSGLTASANSAWVPAFAGRGGLKGSAR